MSDYLQQFHNPTFLRADGQKLPNTSAWQNRHVAAINNPLGPEVAIVRMIQGWARYADQHAARYQRGIGTDGVLGKEWEAIGSALRGLLNGELGRLDGGTLDGFIVNTLVAEGFKGYE